MLVRAGKGGKRRMVGMDDWGWEHVARGTEHRVRLPVGPLFCILAGPTRGRGWSATAARAELRRLASPGRCAAAIRAAPAASCSRDRDGARRDPAADYPEAARACPPRHHVDLSPRNRHTPDRRHDPSPPPAGDPSERRPAAITEPGERVIGASRSRSAPRLDMRDRGATRDVRKRLPFRAVWRSTSWQLLVQVGALASRPPRLTPRGLAARSSLRARPVAARRRVARGIRGHSLPPRSARAAPRSAPRVRRRAGRSADLDRA